ncbi:MAG: exosortase/archaeosortase family protein [Patescibacteria group bacterium]
MKNKINKLFTKLKSWKFWRKEQKGEANLAAISTGLTNLERELEEIKTVSFSNFQIIIILACVTFLVMPFVSTFNEFITTIIGKVELYRILQYHVVPFEAKMVVSTLKLIGIEASSSLTGLQIIKDGNPINIFISWNCIGWQSFILLFISMFVGLKGPFTLNSKLETIAIGILGTIIINLVRISLVAMIAFYLGEMASIVFHDYISTLFVICWLIFYWIFCYRYILHHTDFIKVKAHNS